MRYSIIFISFFLVCCTNPTSQNNADVLNSSYEQYFPTYFKNDQFTKDTSILTNNHRSAIKSVLTFYDHEWKENNGSIFYKGKLDDELLWNYTTKVNDSLSVATHR